ncbi:MAG: spore coat protein [Clostridiales bacterium]|nr:spore coat protein [Clostridiales bacterium]
MSERDMVMDILSGVKAGLASYAKNIAETNDQDLRMTFQQMRDGDEKFQYDLYKLASEKGYYVQPPSSDMLESNQIKANLQQPCAV